MGMRLARTKRIRPTGTGRRRRGQVLVVTLIGMTVLVGLIFFVYNLGDQVNRRLEMQNAADSAAISGANWMARSMNMVAMNNTGQAKLIALVPVMDALPLGTEMSRKETTEWEKMLEYQLQRSIPPMNGGGDLLEEGLSSLRERMATQRDILIAFDEAINHSGFDMTEYTYWHRGGSAPSGMLWRAAVTLGEVSEATGESAGILAQANAVQFGKESHADVAFIAPLLPVIPARRGEFPDFRPVLVGSERVVDGSATVSEQGGRGGAIPDMKYPHRLGPYARLHRWRHYIRQATAWQWVPGTPGVGKTRGGGGNVNVGGRRVGGSARGNSDGGTAGRWAPSDWKTIGYHTFGPYRWAFERIDWYANDHWQWDGPRWYRHHEGALNDTQFYRFCHDLANIKLEYMFKPGMQEKEYHYPQWVWPYPKARTVAQQDPNKVHQTMFYLVEVASKYPPTDSRWLEDGTYRTNGERPIAVWAGGWQDPDKWSVPKVADHIWRDDYWYETTVDEEIGISLIIDEDTKEAIWQKVYMTAFWVFAGVDIGPMVEVRNPCNYDTDSDLPYPIMIDTSEGDYNPYSRDPDEGWRRRYFSFLAVARTHDRSAVWSQKFKNANPSETITAVSQAKLFNHSSWDLWTQDWEVALTPVSKWDDWMQRMEAGLGDTPAYFLSPGDVQEALEYLEIIPEDLAETHMNH